MTPSNLAAFFEHQCRVFEDYIAVVAERNGRTLRLSYGRLLELARLTARALRRSGVRTGDRVLLCAEVGHERVIAHFGIILAGAVDVSLPADMATAHCLQAIDRFGATALLTDRRALTAAVRREIGSFAVILLHRSGETTIPTLRELLDRERTALGRFVSWGASKRGPDDPAAVILQDPTRPLGAAAVLTNQNFLSNVEALVGVLASTEKDRILSVVPAHSATGLLLLYFTVRNGAQIAFAPAEALAETSVKFGPTIVAADLAAVESAVARYARGRVGESLTRVLTRRAFVGLVTLEARARAAFADRRAAFREADSLDRFLQGLWLLATIGLGLFRRVGEMLHGFRPRTIFGPQLRVLFTGGGPFAKSYEYFLRGVGFRVAAGYWLTEAAGLVACRSMEYAGQRDRLVAETVGPMLPDTELRLVNLRGEDVTAAAGQSGEIFVRGPGVMQGYYGDVAATAAAIDAGGWLRTGARGRLTLSGELVLEAEWGSRVRRADRIE